MQLYFLFKCNNLVDISILHDCLTVLQLNSDKIPIPINSSLN